MEWPFDKASCVFTDNLFRAPRCQANYELEDEKRNAVGLLS